MSNLDLVLLNSTLCGMVRRVRTKFVVNVRKTNWVIPLHCCALSARPGSPRIVSSQPRGAIWKEKQPLDFRPHLALAPLCTAGVFPL